ncbi:MAG: 4-hydroxy-tetrahydrodipicolinate reductase [Rhodoluna sp.]|nr:4-hydroxy-tetrahydrodipicolinate reductase [Rhodoluna sp.]
MTIKVSVIGATGRMGKLALEVIQGAQDLELHSALDSKSELASAIGADVIFEATKLEVSQDIVAFAVEHKISILVATSGWSEALHSGLSVSESAVVIVPNFSVGSALATKFAALAAKHFDSIEIVETHHAGKVDSPSGTAIRTAELISSSRKDAGLTQLRNPGVGQEARGQVVAGVPVHSIRLDGVSAKQEILLTGASEVLNISHEVSSVQAYALGILHSIRFAAINPGLTIGLDKVLGI